jgi:hypothetical protein
MEIYFYFFILYLLEFITKNYYMIQKIIYEKTTLGKQIKFFFLNLKRKKFKLKINLY